MVDPTSKEAATEKLADSHDVRSSACLLSSATHGAGHSHDVHSAACLLAWHRDQHQGSTQLADSCDVRSAACLLAWHRDTGSSNRGYTAAHGYSHDVRSFGSLRGSKQTHRAAQLADSHDVRFACFCA